MTQQDNIAATALAVALIALLTTTAQVLGQFFATAEGYRRCQESVMGGWARLTRRHFRWSELRFETIYTTPSFGLSPFTPGQILSKERYSDGTVTKHFQLDGSLQSMKSTFCDLLERSYHKPTELVSWVKFLFALHYNSQATLALLEPSSSWVEVLDHAKNAARGWSGNYLIHDLRVEERSWDFVPPEVTKPLAVIGISDIAVMARRLGMVWKQFDIVEGKMRAEGNGHIITSTTVRSTGTILQISVRDALRDLQDPSRRDELYIPSETADKMGFGIVTGQRVFDLPDYKLGTVEEVVETMTKEVDPGRHALDILKSILKANPGWTPAISDIISLASPMIRQPRSSLVRMPQPSPYAVGLTFSKEGFVVFHRRLVSLIESREAQKASVSSQLHSIRLQYEDLKLRYGDRWEDPTVFDKELNGRSVEFLDDLHHRHDAATQYFVELTARHDGSDEKRTGFVYKDLLYAHIRHGVSYFTDAMARLNASPSQARDNYGLTRVAAWIVEGAHVYFDNIEKVAQDMADDGFDDRDVVEEAWVTMMWKGFLWNRCHFMVEGPRVPSIHWGSRLPVYIG